MEMQNEFGNSGESLPANTFYPLILPDNVRMSSASTMFTDETIRILIRTKGIAPTLFNLFNFYPDTDVRILILIWRRGIVA